MPTCTWGTWFENMECRGDTHGAMKENLSRFGGRNPEKFNFENLSKFSTDSMTQRHASYRGREPLRGRGLKIEPIRFGNSTLKTWSSIEKMGKKGIFFSFLGKIFHKKAHEHAHVHVGHVV